MRAEGASTDGMTASPGDELARGPGAVSCGVRGDLPVSGEPPRVLVLATAGAAVVARVVKAASNEYPGARITLALSEADRWRYPEGGLEHWALGENSIRLDGNVARHEVPARGFDRVLVPVGVPRPGFGSIRAFVDALRPLPVSVRVGGRLRIDSRIPASLMLLGLAVCLHWPLQLVLAVSRLLDGVVLLALQAAAFALGRKPQVGGHPPDGTWCHVVTSLGTGGAQRQVLQVAARQAAKGKHVVVLALFRQGGVFKNQDVTAGVQVETVHDRLRERRILHLLAYALPHSMLVLALVGRLRVLCPGVVWGWQFLANVVASAAARFVRVPYVVTRVENLSAWKTWPEYGQWWYRSADRLTARISDRVVANARALVADYAAWAGAVPEKMRIVPNGFDVQGFLTLPWNDVRPRLGIPSDATVVLSLGRLAPEKNLSMLLRAWAALPSQDATHMLVIVGHGEQESALRKLAQALGIGAHVVFAGKTTEPQSFYRAADVFVMTSRIEGMANVLMEAQLMGLPAVTTAAGGAGEVVVDGETGFVVPIDDERAFVGALDTLLGNPALQKRMGRLAAAHMQSHFSVQRSVDAIDAVIEELGRGKEPA